MDLQRTRIAIIQIEEELDKINVKHRKEKIFWTTAIGDETGELSRHNFEEAEKVIQCVNDPANPNNILVMMKIWDVKLAEKLKRKFNEIWDEAKPFELIG